MNKDILNGNWKELKGKIQKTWGRLTDDDLQEIEGNRTELSGKIQKAYGYTKEDVQKELKNFEDQCKHSGGRSSCDTSETNYQPRNPERH